MGGHHDIKEQVRLYKIIFLTLMSLTMLTVYVAYLEMPVEQAVSIALAIAFVKGSLVACHFMHLLTEKFTIIWIMVLTVIFFFGLMLIPIGHHRDIPGML